MRAVANDWLEFVERCLDEDEFTAREASRRDETYVPTGTHWVWETNRQDLECSLDPLTLEYVGEEHREGTVSLRSREEFPTSSVGPLPQFAMGSAEEVPIMVGAHIVRHDPARILAEVAAKRELLARHTAYYGDGDDSHWPVPVIRLLAEAYRERPGYPGKNPFRSE